MLGQIFNRKNFILLVKINVCLFVIGLIALVLIHNFYAWTANNRGVKQLSLLDKAEFAARYSASFKMGIFEKRALDVKILGRFMKSDPYMIKFHSRLQKKYGRVVAFDYPFSKLFVVLDPALSEQLLNRDDVLGPPAMKDYVFHNFMATNLAVMRGKARTLKRRFNEELFGTRKYNTLFGHIEPVIDKYLVERPMNSKELREANFKIMSSLFLGNTQSEHIQTLKKFMDHVDRDTNITMGTIWYKIFPNQSLKQSFKKIIFDSLKKVGDHDTTLNRSHSVMELVKHYSDKYEDKNELDMHNEMPHWIVPLHVMMNVSIPHLVHIIISFPEIYHKVKTDIYSADFDLYRKDSYFHFCILEHLRMFNIINITVSRKAEKDFQVDEIFVPKNTELQFLNYTMLRNPQRYPDPDTFIPERWEHKTVEEQNMLFGHGAQQCPSIQFSPFFIKTYVYVMLTKFKLQPLKENIYDNLKLETSLLEYTFTDSN